MALPKYTLTYNEANEMWELKRDDTDEVVRIFETKEEALRKGVLEEAVGPEGGSVKIQAQDGKFEEERTYPRSADPKKTPG